MRLPLFPIVLISCAAGLEAQTIERPQAFDSAQRVVAVTPALAGRLRLEAPVWPARGDYREARLYTVEPTGGFVLVVQQTSGVLERYPLTDDERGALRAVIDAAMSTSGRPSGESATDVVSEPAGNAFARHQTALAATIYAPLAASLADDGSAAGALYLLVTGGTFFASYAATQSTPFTRAQSALAADLGLAAGANGFLIGYAASGRTDRNVRAVAFASAVAGTIAGATLGQSLSDAEAHGAYLGIESSSAAAVVASIGFGQPGRGTATAVVAVAPIGYLLGVQYPRRAGYHVTAGDVEAVGTVGLIGTLATGAVIEHMDHPSDRQAAGFLAGGFLAGALLGDRVIAHRLDLTEAQASILNVAAGAGALIGAAVPVIAGSSDASSTLASGAVGAVLGMSVIASSFHPGGASELPGAGRFRSARPSFHGVALSVHSASAVAALIGIPGRHALVRLTF